MSTLRSPRAAARRPLTGPLLALLAVLALLASACGSNTLAPTAPPDATSSQVPATTATPAAPTPTAEPSFPLDVIDDEDTTVAIEAEPQHIVSLTPAATETLFAIGAGDRVVAKVEDVAAYPPEADDLPIVATYLGVDVEQIVNLEADLVIAGGGDPSFTPRDSIDQLRSLGIPVVVLYAETVQEALSGIARIGLAAGEARAASELAGAMQAEFQQLGAATSTLEHPKTFYEIDATTNIYTVPENSLYAEMLLLAGADPITTDDSYEISLETIVAADPAVILLGDAAYGVTAETVTARPGWGGIKAVVDQAIFPVEDVLITRPGPRLLEGLRSLIEALHPEVLR